MHLFNNCRAIGCTTLVPHDVDFCSECEAEQMASERDPHGLDQHQTGAKVDAGKIRMHLVTGGMARAITEVAKIATFGAAKYTDNGWINVPDGFRRYEDAQQRHAAKRHMGEELDTDSGLLHLAHEAWNALAKLDLYIRDMPKTPPVSAVQNNKEF